MAALRQYILSVVCCGLMCGILPLLVSGSGKKVLKLVCGIVLTVTVISPVLRVDAGKILTALIPEEMDMEIAAEGQSRTRSAMASIIKQETEAYILDKAEGLGLSLTVTVRLSDGDIPIPIGVEFQGEAEAEKRWQLSTAVAKELGIPEEAQQWIG